MTSYSQNNPAWSEDRLGNSIYTMGQAGCLVTSLAIIATNLGHPVTPAQMLSLLESHNLINSNGDVTRMDALTVIFPDIVLSASKTWPSDKADLSFLGANTIIEIDDSPSAGMQTHFMPVEQVVGNDVKVLDVWDGVNRNVSAYGARWTPAVSAAAIIYGAYKYAKKAVAAPAKPVAAKPVTTASTQPTGANKGWVGKTLYLHPVAQWHVYRVGAQPILSNAIGFLVPKNYNHGPNGKPGLTYPILAASKYANTVTIQTDTYGKVDIYVDKDAEIL